MEGNKYTTPVALRTSVLAQHLRENNPSIRATADKLVWAMRDIRLDDPDHHEVRCLLDTLLILTLRPHTPGNQNFVADIMDAIAALADRLGM